MNDHPSTQNRPYQGYPYVNPIVLDAPSINAADAAKWQNLPRRPVRQESSSKNTSTSARQNPPDKQDPEDRPVIYINIPEEDQTAAENIEESGQVNDEENAHRKEETNGEPVVYIEMTERRTEETRTEEANQSNPAFVEETIFYDPFEDRRIDVNRSEASTSRNDELSPERPRRPVLPSYSAEGTSQDLQNRQSRVPSFMSKEAYIYGQQPQDDGLRLSPLPVSSPEYPDPPPAYAEVDPSRRPELPRTEVVVPDNSPVVTANPNRKNMMCPYCGRRVLTLVVRENGVLTHILGIIFFIAFFPLTFCIYFTDCCKYRNHYCPQCNHLIAYEVPILCQKEVYNKV